MLEDSEAKSSDEQNDGVPTLYKYIERAFAKLKNALELSTKFQVYCKETYGGAPPTATIGGSTPAPNKAPPSNSRRVQRKLLSKWRNMHDALDTALAAVVADIEPLVLQSFENEHIVLVFYSVVANYAIDVDGSAETQQEERWWPKLDSADDVTAHAYKLSRSIEKKLMQDEASDSFASGGAVHGQPRVRNKPIRAQRCNQRRVRMQTDSVACTSTGYFADGCRVHALHGV